MNVKAIKAFYLISRSSLRRILLTSGSLVNNIFFLSKLYFSGKKIVVITLIEHIGDVIACSPVAKYARLQYPDHLVIWCIKRQYTEVALLNPYVDHALSVTCLSEWILLRKLKLFSQSIELHIDGRECDWYGVKLHNPNQHGITLSNYFEFGALLESFSLAAGIPKICDAPFLRIKDGIPLQNLPENYIVFHCSSNEECKNWSDNKWDLLARSLIETGFKIIEIGKDRKVSINSTSYIDLCGKFNFNAYAAIIKEARLFVGIDSGFAHFANALQCPGIILMGEYRNFKKYNPYTGNYKYQKDSIVINHQGAVKDIEVVDITVCASRILKEWQKTASDKKIITKLNFEC